MGHEPGTWLNAFDPLIPHWAHGFVNANVLTAWMLAAVLLAVFAWAARDLRVVPVSALQVGVEAIWGFITNTCDEMIGRGGRRFAPFLATFFLYILLLNLAGVVPGFLSPTANLGMTGALGLVAALSAVYFGFRVQGLRYLKHFVGEPWWLFPINIPVHVISVFLARPLSLAVRLFGNIFGEDMVIAQFIALSVAIMAFIKVPLPLQLPMVLFHILVSLIQALVFTLLTASYIAEAVEIHEPEGKH